MFRTFAVLATLLAGTTSSYAQNSFPTPGGATAGGAVMMCDNGSGQKVPCTSTNPMPIVGAPSALSAVGVAPDATQAAASNSVLKASAGNLYRATVTIGATSGWVMIFDATALPGNGATGASLKYCVPVNSDGTKGFLDISFGDIPAAFATGITVGFSSTACNSLTASATAFFYGQHK